MSGKLPFLASAEEAESENGPTSGTYLSARLAGRRGRDRTGGVQLSVWRRMLVDKLGNESTQRIGIADVKRAQLLTGARIQDRNVRILEDVVELDVALTFALFVVDLPKNEVFFYDLLDRCVRPDITVQYLTSELFTVLHIYQ